MSNTRTPNNFDTFVFSIRVEQILSIISILAFDWIFNFFILYHNFIYIFFIYIFLQVLFKVFFGLLLRALFGSLIKRTQTLNKNKNIIFNNIKIGRPFAKIFAIFLILVFTLIMLVLAWTLPHSLPIYMFISLSIECILNYFFGIKLITILASFVHPIV